MPLFTYYNLSEEKRKQIIRLSLEEFANHDYESASVSRIVKQVGVAKGSFYRYFRNKFDLYSFLVDHTSELQKDQSKKLTSDADSFSEVLVQNYYARIQFDIDFPLQGKFLYNMMRERNSQELGNMMLKHKKAMMKVILGMIEKYQFKGELRSDIDREWLAFQVIHLQYGIHDYLSLQLERLNKKSKVKVGLVDIQEEEILRTIRGFVGMLINGIQQPFFPMPDLIPTSAKRQVNS